MKSQSREIRLIMIVSLWNLTGCWGACQISEWLKKYKLKFCGFDISWDLVLDIHPLSDQKPWISTVVNLLSTFPGMRITMLKIRWSRDSLIFNMGIPILVRRHLYIETDSWISMWNWAKIKPETYHNTCKKIVASIFGMVMDLCSPYIYFFVWTIYNCLGW